MLSAPQYLQVTCILNLISAAVCPKLSTPAHGTYAPASCLTGDQLPGDRCVLHCSPGYKPERAQTIVCDSSLLWSPTFGLHCVQDNIDQEHAEEENEVINRFSDDQIVRPVAASTNQVIAKVNHTNIPVIPRGSLGQHGYQVHETAQRVNPAYHLKPFIKCPRDTTIILPKGQKTVYIKLEQPRTNVDWRR